MATKVELLLIWGVLFLSYGMSLGIPTWRRGSAVYDGDFLRILDPRTTPINTRITDGLLKNPEKSRNSSSRRSSVRNTTRTTSQTGDSAVFNQRRTITSVSENNTEQPDEPSALSLNSRRGNRIVTAQPKGSTRNLPQSRTSRLLVQPQGLAVTARRVSEDILLSRNFTKSRTRGDERVRIEPLLQSRKLRYGRNSTHIKTENENLRKHVTQLKNNDTNSELPVNPYKARNSTFNRISEPSRNNVSNANNYKAQHNLHHDEATRTNRNKNNESPDLNIHKPVVHNVHVALTKSKTPSSFLRYRSFPAMSVAHTRQSPRVISVDRPVSTRISLDELRRKLYSRKLTLGSREANKIKKLRGFTTENKTTMLPSTSTEITAPSTTTQSTTIPSTTAPSTTTPSTTTPSTTTPSTTTPSTTTPSTTTPSTTTPSTTIPSTTTPSTTTTSTITPSTTTPSNTTPSTITPSTTTPATTTPSTTTPSTTAPSTTTSTTTTPSTTAPSTTAPSTITSSTKTPSTTTPSTSTPSTITPSTSTLSTHDSDILAVINSSNSTANTSTDKSTTKSALESQSEPAIIASEIPEYDYEYFYTDDELMVIMDTTSEMSLTTISLENNTDSLNNLNQTNMLKITPKSISINLDDMVNKTISSDISTSSLIASTTVHVSFGNTKTATETSESSHFNKSDTNTSSISLDESLANYTVYEEPTTDKKTIPSLENYFTNGNMSVNTSSIKINSTSQNPSIMFDVSEANISLERNDLQGSDSIQINVKTAGPHQIDIAQSPANQRLRKDPVNHKTDNHSPPYLYLLNDPLLVDINDRPSTHTHQNTEIVSGNEKFELNDTSVPDNNRESLDLVTVVPVPEDIENEFNAVNDEVNLKAMNIDTNQTSTINYNMSQNLTKSQILDSPVENEPLIEVHKSSSQSSSHSVSVSAVRVESHSVVSHSVVSSHRGGQKLPTLSSNPSVLIQAPLALINADKPFSPHGSNQFGTNPFGKAPAGVSPFGANPFGQQQRGISQPVTISTELLNSKVNNSEVVSDILDVEQTIQVERPSILPNFNDNDTIKNNSNKLDSTGGITLQHETLKPNEKVEELNRSSRFHNEKTREDGTLEGEIGYFNHSSKTIFNAFRFEAHENVDPELIAYGLALWENL